MSLIHDSYNGREIVRQKLMFEGDAMEPAIVYVYTGGEVPKRLYHSRRGLTEHESDATRFKTFNHALRTARKKYRGGLTAGDFRSYNIVTVNVLKGE
jgi:hypothetical protein